MKGYKGKVRKSIRVTLVGDAEQAFHDLNKIVGEQRLKGVLSSKEITLLTALHRLFDLLKENPFYGENSKKSLIPKKYLVKYGAENLFIADLPDYWRLIYTLESNEIEIITFVLDIVDHDAYDGIFGFRKR